MEPKDLEQIIGRHLKAIYQALVDGGAESRLLGSEGSVHVDANQGHDIVSFVDVREGKARKLAALLEVEPVLASGHELFELAPERFGQLGRRGRQNARQPARFAEADDGGADPPVAKRRLQGRSGKVGVPLLAHVRHATDGVQGRFAGGAVPIAPAGAARAGQDAATVDGGIHDSDASVLGLLDQLRRAAIDERPPVMYEQHFEDTELQVTRHLVHITACDADVPDLPCLAQPYERINGTAGGRHGREVVKLRVVEVDQGQRRQTEAILALPNGLPYAVTRVVTTPRIDLRRDHEVRRKAARTVDAQTDSLFAPSLGVSVRRIEKADRAGENCLHEFDRVVLRHLIAEVLRHAAEWSSAGAHRRDRQTRRA